MRILFSIGAANPGGDANYNIVYTVAQALARRGHTCHIAITAPEAAADSCQPGEIPVYRIALPPVRRHNQAAAAMTRWLESRPGLAGKAVFALRHPIQTGRVLYQLHVRPLYWQAARAYAPGVRRLVRAGGYDAVVCLVIPWEYAMTVFAGKGLGVPRYLYQLDPWAQHVNVRPQDYEKVLARELAVFRKARHIFTTPALLAEYAHTAHSTFLDKITAVEFPRLAPPEGAKQDVVAFDPAFCNLVYCGSLEDDVRDPSCALAVLAALARQGMALRVYFVGRSGSRVLAEYVRQLPDVFFRVPPQPARTAQAIMQGADALLNIDNVVTNQVPSKLFDYICLGLPLISTVKSPESPVLPYLKQYPLALALDEHAQPQALAAQLADFLRENKGKRLPYQQVAERFAACTADYVAGQFETYLKQ